MGGDLGVALRRSTALLIGFLNAAEARVSLNTLSASQFQEPFRLTTYEIEDGIDVF